MKARHLWYVLGVALLGWGLRGLITSTPTAGLVHAGRFLVAGVVAHDGVLAPAAFGLAYLTQRLLPEAARTAVRVGLAVSLVLVLLALPVILSDHRYRTPSALPLPYERNLVILLGATALGVVLSLAVARWRRR